MPLRLPYKTHGAARHTEIGGIIKPRCQYSRYISSRVRFFPLECRGRALRDYLPPRSSRKRSFPFVRGHDLHRTRDVFRAFAKLVCRVLHLAVKRTVNPVRLSERSSDLMANHARNFGATLSSCRFTRDAHTHGSHISGMRNSGGSNVTPGTVRNGKVNERDKSSNGGNSFRKVLRTMYRRQLAIRS